MAFWSAIALVVMLAYPASFGPVCWVCSRSPEWDFPDVVESFYSPILRMWSHGPDLVSDAIGRYANLWSAVHLDPARVVDPAKMADEGTPCILKDLDGGCGPSEIFGSDGLDRREVAD